MSQDFSKYFPLEKICFQIPYGGLQCQKMLTEHLVKLFKCTYNSSGVNVFGLEQVYITLTESFALNVHYSAMLTLIVSDTLNE